MTPTEATLISNVDQHWALLVEAYRNTLNRGGSGEGLARLLGSKTSANVLAQLMLKDDKLAESVKQLAWAAFGETIKRASEQFNEELEE